MVKYIAFLRAINVGGKNIIKMNEVKKKFESIGCKDVSTYIQSGNVLFSSDITDEKVLVKKIQNELHKTLSNDVIVFLKTQTHVRLILEDNPFKKVKSIEAKRYITFIRDELKKKLNLPYFSSKKDVEIISVDGYEICCLSHEIKGSYGFPNLFVENEFKIKATTRNWNTLEKIVSTIK